MKINGLITAFVIREKADPFHRMIGEGKLEVRKTVTLSPVKAVFRTADCGVYVTKLKYGRISVLGVQALKRRDRRTYDPCEHW